MQAFKYEKKNNHNNCKFVDMNQLFEHVLKFFTISSMTGL